MAIKKCNNIWVKKVEKPFVEIFADGACSGNPGVGGYGIILKYWNRKKEISGCDPFTTNNRMELTAVVKSLEALKRPCRVKLVTDSNYVIQGITKWISRWLKNNWKNAQRQDVANRDLWERLLNLLNFHEIEWKWIRGHSGCPENERCDKLAKAAIDKCKKKREV